MRNGNLHLGRKAFKFKGLKDLADIADPGDHAVSYDLISEYYHVAPHPISIAFVGFKWEGEYYVYSCLSFGLLTAPWVFSKGFWQCARMARRVKKDLIRPGLKINIPKCHTIPAQQQMQLGFDLDFAGGMFRVPADRCEELKLAGDAILSSRHGRVKARRLTSVTGTVMSTRLLWGPMTQLYTRHLYALINSVPLLNCWVVLTEEAVNELFF